MMNKSRFTMIELLVVIGIIAILAGLLIPTVIGAKENTRISQARTDMSSLKTAFAGLERDYGRMTYGSNHALGGHNFSASNGCITISETSSTDIYCGVIAELADPNNSGFTPSLNRRRIKYLDPRPTYNPSNPPYGSSSGNNPQNTWLDPWGKPYQIRINVDATGRIPDPSSSGTLSGSIILWSLGPDGEGSDTANAESNKDNIPSWKDGNWLD